MCKPTVTFDGWIKERAAMTEALFREDSYLRECQATVLEAGPGSIVLDRTVFYPMGGGQPGDTGTISWDGGSVQINDTRHGDAGAIRHLTDTDAAIPDKGTSVTATLDWDRRYLHMRMHTALHLLGSVLQYGVTGGNISATKSRLDFDMEDTVDKEQITPEIQALVAADHPLRPMKNSTHSLIWFERCLCNHREAPGKSGCWKSKASICNRVAEPI